MLTLTNYHFFSSLLVSKHSFLDPFFISHLSLSSTHLLFHQLHIGQCSSWLCAINGFQTKTNKKTRLVHPLLSPRSAYVCALSYSVLQLNRCYLSRFGSRVACNAPFILTPFSFLNLIILTSILVTSVLHSWYCLALALAVSSHA